MARRSGRPFLKLVAVGAAALLAWGHAQSPGEGWVHAGLRLTFYASAASVPGPYGEAVWKPDCDPRYGDCWTDPATGLTYGRDEGWASGQGFTRIDILYLDAQWCAVRLTSYTLDPTTGAVLTAMAGGGVTAGGCNDYWQDPASLAALQGQVAGGRRVDRGPYTLAGRTFQTVSLSASGASGASHSVYDAATGLLLVNSTRAPGAKVPVVTGGGLAAGAAGVQQTYSELLDVRDVPGLAIAEALPRQAADLSYMRYACTQVTEVPGAGAVQVPCQLDVTVRRRTPYWLEVDTLVQVASGMGAPLTSQSTDLIGSGGHGGLFASPAYLASLRPGQTLGGDPVTGVQAAVTQADGASVTVVEQSNAEVKTFVYDVASGWLVRFSQEQRVGLGSVSTYFELATLQ